MVTAEEVWDALAEIPDPEIPVISLVDLGVVKDVEVEDGTVRVDFTPTFMGCPALEVMQRAMEAKIAELGAEPDVRVRLDDSWSTDDITAEGREKLRAAGFAPPTPRPAGRSSSCSCSAASAARTAARPRPGSRTSSARRRAARSATARTAASRSSSSRRSSSRHRLSCRRRDRAWRGRGRPIAVAAQSVRHEGEERPAASSPKSCPPTGSTSWRRPFLSAARATMPSGSKRVGVDQPVPLAGLDTADGGLDGPKPSRNAIASSLARRGPV